VHPKLKLAIVIVNFRTPSLTLDAVESGLVKE
jgi:hypothetical protein